jgi:hypothetical protein
MDEVSSHLSPVDQHTEAVGWDFGKIGPEGGHGASRGNPQCPAIRMNDHVLQELPGLLCSDRIW